MIVESQRAHRRHTDDQGRRPLLRAWPEPRSYPRSPTPRRSMRRWRRPSTSGVRRPLARR